jgi:hypothetical protein
MTRIPSQLQYFLQSYLLPMPGATVREAAAAFVAAETDFSVASLASDARYVAGLSEEDLVQVARSVDPEGFTRLGHWSELRKLALSVYENLASSDIATRKPVDVFVSYSTADEGFATRLATALRQRGFSIWLDRWNVLVGHSIVDEVYGGIARADFLAVVLSRASVRSRWVARELTAALVREIEDRSTTVLPVLKEDCNIPTALRDKRYADFRTSWEEGFEALASAIQFLPRRRDLAPPSRDTTREVDHLQSELDQRATDAGFDADDPVKSVYVVPMATEPVRIERVDLLETVEACQVRTDRWGGPDFPYARGERARVIRDPRGLLLMDNQPWPFQSRSAHIWRFNVDGTFASRSLIEEDFITGLDAEEHPHVGTLSVHWAIHDIVRPVLFANRYLLRRPAIGAVGVTLRWRGLRNRRLTMLDRRRRWSNRYLSKVPEWSQELRVRPGADSRQLVISSVRDLFWQFGFDAPLGPSLEHDIQTFLDGRFPD